jgi:hypothetical protein
VEQLARDLVDLASASTRFDHSSYLTIVRITLPLEPGRVNHWDTKKPPLQLEAGADR